MTKRTDLIVPEVLAEAIKGAFAGMKLLYGSPVAVLNTSMPDSRGGDKVKVPYFGTLGEVEDVVEGNALTPKKLTMTSEEAVVQHSGIAFEMSKWAEIAANYADPYAEAARQAVESVARRAEKALIDAAITSLPSAMIKDVYSATVPKTLDYDAAVAAKMLFGDEQDDIAMLAVHSKTLGDLYTLKDNSGRPLLTDPNVGGLARLVNMPVGCSDRLAPTADTPAKYTSLGMKPGSLVFWMNGSPTVDTDKDILADSTVAAVHIYWVAHRYVRLPGRSKGGVVAITHN